MRAITVCLLVAGISAFGQQVRPSFRFPDEVKPGDYSSQFVLVKMIKKYSGVLQSESFAPPAKSGLQQITHAPIVHTKSIEKARLRNSPRISSSGIDIKSFGMVRIQGTDVEGFINKLYSTGMYELVEPIYRDKFHFTPNDEYYSSQYYLNKILAPQSWEIADGQDIVIGIVDSGGDMDHPDLVDKIYIDPAEPIDGIDNDGDGYIDNNKGWDFIGDDTLNLNLPGFIGDNNPNNLNGGISSHGTEVAGCAAASVNNTEGIAGVGYKAKIMFTKHAADNQGTSKGGIYFGYSGLLYAATHGARVINLSWGGPYSSEIIQQLIDYVALDLGCLIIASAGNDANGKLTYPASYNNVLSVAATDEDDKIADFSSYGNTVDISAPGVNIKTTAFNNAYASVDGTSFSAPIVSGAAALVWSAFPDYTATQIGELLRVTADENIYNLNPSSLSKKLGKGRLDVQKALTTSLPAIRASKPRLVNSNGTLAEPGQNAFLSMDFTNYLSSTSGGLQITIKSLSTSAITVLKTTINPGIIDGGSKINTKFNPFELKINQGVGANTRANILITYSDGSYNDYQYLSFLLNPTFIDVNQNEISTTIASNGRIGYENSADGTNGVGFIYNESPLLFEMGIIAGNAANKIYNNVRGIDGNFDQDFTTVNKIREITPGERSSSETFGSFVNNTSPAVISVNYRSLAWRETPYDKFIILEYKIKNVSGAALTGFNFTLFSDWDISYGGQQDIARWDAETNMGYIYPAVESTRPHAGIRILTGNSPIHYAIDNNEETPGTPFGLYDGYTDSEKFTSISSGIGRVEAGTSGSEGGDVSHVVGAGPYDLAPEQEITVAFALLAANNLSELKDAAAQADTVYNLMLAAPKPVVSDNSICYNTGTTITATGAGIFKWYDQFTGGNLIYQGSTLNTGILKNDTTYYVSNADNSYESVRSIAHVNVKGNPTIFSSATGSVCEGNTVTLSVAPADNYLWSNGATTQSILITEAGDYTVEVSDFTLNCFAASDIFTLNINPVPVAAFEISGNELYNNTPLTFVNNSTGASNYIWDFGDLTSSTEELPEHSFALVKEYTISLTAYNEFGCNSTATQAISVITGLEEINDSGISIYPNPAANYIKINLQGGIESAQVIGTNGKTMLTLNSRFANELPIDSLPAGLYFIKIQTTDKKLIVKKLIKD
jgi:serine protease